jgi:hypothetical protein
MNYCLVSVPHMNQLRNPLLMNQNVLQVMLLANLPFSLQTDIIRLENFPLATVPVYPQDHWSQHNGISQSNLELTNHLADSQMN